MLHLVVHTPPTAMTSSIGATKAQIVPCSVESQQLKRKYSGTHKSISTTEFKRYSECNCLITNSSEKIYYKDLQFQVASYPHTIVIITCHQSSNNCWQRKTYKVWMNILLSAEAYRRLYLW